MYNRDDLVASLRQNIVEVTFTKVNGEQRVMKCSLMKSMLPPQYINEQEEEKKFHADNPDVIAAWDIEKGGWRSFRVDSVEYIQVVDVI